MNSVLSFQLFFEHFLTKLAVESLKMDEDEYKHLREEHNQGWIIDELQRRSREKGLPDYSLRALREALLKNLSIANRTFQEWQPPQVYKDMFSQILITNQLKGRDLSWSYQHFYRKSNIRTLNKATHLQ